MLSCTSGLHLKDSIAQILVQSTILAQHSCYGDGGLLSGMIASQLVLATLDVARTHAARLKFITAYQQVLGWVSELTERADAVGRRYHAGPDKRSDDHRTSSQPDPLEASHCPCCSVVLSLRDAGAQAYVAVVRNVVASKQVGGSPSPVPVSQGLSGLLGDAWMESIHPTLHVLQ